MKKFILGLVLGLSLSAGLTFANGFMMGWTVKINTSDGLEVECDDPYIWTGIKEIECDGGHLN